MVRFCSWLCIFLLLQTSSVFGRELQVKIPAGTKVYCELTQRVVSKKAQFQVGDRVRVRVWRDVVINGHTVIHKGSPVNARISFLKTNKIAGVKGKVEIAARSCFMADDNEIMLSGGYGREGKSFVGGAIALSAVLLWPLIFVMGKKADLPIGTVFDAYTDETKTIIVEVAGDQRNLPKIDLSGLFVSYGVEIDYDSLAAQKKPKSIPILITHESEKEAQTVEVIRVNGKGLGKNLPVTITSSDIEEDEVIIRAEVDVKKLFKHFTKGINRFEVQTRFSDGSVESEEVMFDIQF